MKRRFHNQSAAKLGERCASKTIAAYANRLRSELNPNLWLPASSAPLELKTAPLGDIAQFGKYHLSIIGRPPQGCFTKAAFSATATYPALWNHNARNETRIVCEPDSELRARRGMEDQARAVWATASRAHLTRGIQVAASQPLTGSAFTDQGKRIGGSSWPNVIFDA